MVSGTNHRQGLRNVIILLCIFGVFAASVPCSITQSNAQEGGGTLTTHSTGEGKSSSSGLTGHSWLEYTPDGGETTTYGTWPFDGVKQDAELDMDSEASRTSHINETQEQSLMDYINEQEALGSGAWTPLHNCSSFASEGWEAATGEHVSPGWIPNPTTFRENIVTANGGQPRGSVGGGTQGGVESKPLVGPPSTFLSDVAAAGHLVIATSPQSEQLVKLEDLIPVQGPDNTTAVPTIPVDALGLTETSDAAAVDFVDDDTGVTKAVVLGIETTVRPHDHDYAVCNSYHGYSVDNVAPIPFPDLLPGVTEANPPWFWYILTQKDELLEEALTFVVFVDEAHKSFIIDSRWLVDYYPEQFGFYFDYVFNFQVWASSSEESYRLLQRTVENLASFDNAGWTVSFINEAEPIAPTVLIRKAEYLDNEVQLTVQSWLTETQSVTFYGSCRSYDDWETSMGFNRAAEVSPGTSSVVLSFENLLDAVIVSDVDGFMSKVYVGSGFWFVFSDEQSTVTMTPGQCAPIENVSNDKLVLAGCAKMTGTIATTYGYVGLVRTLNPNGRPVDVSEYQALTFMARGDGKSYQVKLETDAVEDYDYHQFVFTPVTDEWRQYIIPLSLFRQQGWGVPSPFTGTDVKSVVWASIGPHCDDAVELDVDQVAFINSLVVANTTGPVSINDAFGPYEVTTEINGDIGVDTVTLYYSVDGGDFTGVAMTGDAHTFTGQIPGQSLGTEVRYYIEASDVDGNVTTDPVDAPYTTHHFRVEWYPSLLVDDFGDPNPNNVLGCGSGIFKDPDEGGIITSCYDGDVLRLTFDVTGHLPGIDEYAGYHSGLEQADLRPYNSVSLRVRGEHGGEKVKLGVNDGLDHEPKIELGEYLLDGITTDWQTVRIPLAAFTEVADWSQMHSFTFAFEERIGSGNGTIYIDDVQFGPKGVPVMVHNFNDMTDPNGVSGSTWTASDGGASVGCGYDPVNRYGDVGYGLYIAYTGVTEAAWAVWGTDLMGLDGSRYDGLSFYIKGANGGEVPNVYLFDETAREFVDIEDYAIITDTWRRVEIPMENFGVSVTNLRYLQFAFEWEEMSGTIYVDDMRFTTPPSPTITALSPVMTTNDVSTTLTLTGTNFLMTPTVALGYNLLENVRLLSSTVLKATIPPGVSPGFYDVKLIQPNLQSGELSGILIKPSTIWGAIYLPFISKD